MKRRYPPLIAIIILALFLTGCQPQISRNGITQVATIDALMAGVYDGHMTLKTLRSYGNFGIGTFEALDGEMFLLDGEFYQVKADGLVYLPSLEARTPFACVTRFSADKKENIDRPTGLLGLEEKIDALAPEANRFCAFIVRGDFSAVRTRSVPAQKKPYPPLAEVTKTQPVFELKNVRGTLIGFRAPAFVKGINVPGYHLHFLADDLGSGGHVLDLTITRGVLEADTVHDWLNLYLPGDSKSFGTADLKTDRSKELKIVEQGK
ncbi:MAG: acetolactate decarboxylase [Candidatus Margulisiibacteriota bacterium]